MAARKKATGKTRTKARKAPARKAAKRGKSRKTPAARRAPPKARAKSAARPRPALPEAMAPPGARVGVVTHYFSHLSVAVIRLETGTLRVGDSIHIRGHTTDFGQRVDSLQVDRAAVQEVGPRDDFGLKVREHAREHDIVYKVA